MCEKAHGSSAVRLQLRLRWGCEQAMAERLCNFNRGEAEPFGAFRAGGFVEELQRAGRDGAAALDFFDSNSGALLFRAPRGRTCANFLKECKAQGRLSFRDAEVNWGRVRLLHDGEVVSIDGTHCGQNLPDGFGTDTASTW